MDAKGAVKFGEWLPDLPFYANPGLVEAKNVLPVDGSYKDYLQMLASGEALGTRPQGGMCATDAAGDPEIYAGTDAHLYQRVGTNWTDRTPAPYSTPSNGYWRFAQFDALIIATNYSDDPQSKTVGAATNFAALALTGSAPKARQVGVIGRFVMLGDTDEIVNGTVPYRVQWPAIDDPTDWPTPNTLSARTVQAGEQILNSSYGAVTAIANGQFYGLVFQQRGINRFTYVGGDVVFQVQTIDENRGCWAPQSMIQIGGRSYFLAADGFYMTDGQAVLPIGNGKIDKTFYADFDQTYRERMTVGVDYINKCILWAYPSASATAGVPDKLIAYNFIENRWTHAEDVLQMIFSSLTQGYTLEQLDSLFTSIDDMTISLDSSLWSGGIPTVMGFSGNTLGTFSGAAKDARFETGESDMPFGKNYVGGVKPLVTGEPASVTVSVSTRSRQDNEARAFGAPVSRSSRTGVCDFRTQGNYVSARMDVTGGFDRAMGLQYDTSEGDGV